MKFDKINAHHLYHQDLGCAKEKAVKVKLDSNCAEDFGSQNRWTKKPANAGSSENRTSRSQGVRKSENRTFGSQKIKPLEVNLKKSDLYESD